jgi:hypothetical protein
MGTPTETLERPSELVDEEHPPRRRPTLDDVWMVLGVAAPVLLALLARLPTIDLAYHLRVGSLMRATHALPKVETMTFGAGGGASIDQHWGAQVLLSIVHDLDGFASLVALRGLCVATAAALLIVACRARGASARAACGFTVATYLVAMPYLVLRPQLFGAVLFAWCVLVLAARHRHPWLLWTLPVVAAIWANVHGSFPLVVATASFAWLEDLLLGRGRRGRWKRSAIVTLVTVGATLLNPFGVSAWGYVVSLGTNPTIREAVEEWRPPTTETLTGAMFLIALVASGGLLARRGRALGWLDLVWVGGFSVLALSAQRNVLWWAIAVAPLFASLSSRGNARPVPSRPSDSRASRIVNVTIVSALAIMPFVALPWVGRTTPLISGAPPPDLIDAGRRLHDGALLFVYQPWASWIEYDVPNVRVFVDSRIEIFPDQAWRDYRNALLGGSDAEEILDRWNVDAVLMPAEETPLLAAIDGSPDWTLALQHREGSLYVRSDDAGG